MATQKNELIEQLDNTVRQHFADYENPPSEDEVREYYELVYGGFASFMEEPPQGKGPTIDYLATRYITELTITKSLGFAYADEDTKPWVDKAEEDIETHGGWYYWSRYKHYLLRTKRWAQKTVRTIDRDTKVVLDLMANPMNSAGFERMGLVVASVQSGKTANYIGLVCRAADAGYKIIVVMAGVHNVLRYQTQVRLEEGFTGFNVIDPQTVVPVGVGLQNKDRRPIACTSRESDFNRARAAALKGIKSAHTNEPWLFVVKKNSNSLKQLYSWLKDNADPSDSLLLIDDEADNASINGKYKREKREDEPTRINGQIRNILNLFAKRCYVGYTATPYANILIDPEVDTEQYGKDLFPSSFIYTLEESSDYFGAEKVFDDYDEANPKYLRIIDDIDTMLPPKHKSDWQVEDIPETLKEAVRTYILATTIRMLRGDAYEHSSMMVNVSPYKVPQRSVAYAIVDYLEQLTDAFKVYGSLNPSRALMVSEDLQFMQGTWISEYASRVEFDWSVIQPELYNTMTWKDAPIHVVSVNSDANQPLEYELHTEHVIAVGGYRLSRGLTLEGLVVSYYSRNAKAYDALMQMARWFGYRPGYEELCRIWMSERSAGWYKFVADSTSDLFDELRNMRQVQRTPRNYGLKIRQSPDSLIVTARNKMGTGTRLPAPIDLNNGFVETVAFDRNKAIIERNLSATRNIIESITNYRDNDSDRYFYTNVPVLYIIEYLNGYYNDDALSPKSQKKPVLDYIDDRMLDGELALWDVLIAQGDGKSFHLADGVTVRREVRFPGEKTSPDSIVVGEKHRLASRGVEKTGLDEPAIKKACEEFYSNPKNEGRNVADRYYRKYRTRPLLILHPVLMRYTDLQIKRKRDDKKIELPPAYGWTDWEHEEVAYGWSISFPHTDKQTKLVEYVFNQIAIDNMRADYEEDSDDDYEDD